ncbi:hypothetical protein BD779DRAFT_1677722 [Infundibulicybe gibba]|nr:hypothetical protein BD779DRAFT_1677722 [Infundibulicybe gibba]
MGSKPSKPNGLDSQLVRGILATHLPLELADEILGDVMYGPKICASEHKHIELSASDGRDDDASWRYLVTPPLGSHASRLGGEGSAIKARMVRFRICSYGQGGSSQPELPSRGIEHDGAYSWFEAIILRPIPPAEEKSNSFRKHARGNPASPSSSDLSTYGTTLFDDGGAKWVLQCNTIASDTPMDHEIIWTRGNGCGNGGNESGARFVAALQEGDRVAVIARAKFPRVNYVESIQVDIYYD